MIGRLIGFAPAARQMGEAARGLAQLARDRTGRDADERDVYEHDAHENERRLRALAQFGEEFTHPASSRFDGFVNGMNRLPRPMMAVGTLGLFVYAMADPAGFAGRMRGLAAVPEPLWWLLGAVVSFYFGARELHHYRGRTIDLPPARRTAPPAPGDGGSPPAGPAGAAAASVPAAAPGAPAAVPLHRPAGRAAAARGGAGAGPGGLARPGAARGEGRR